MNRLDTYFARALVAGIAAVAGTSVGFNSCRESETLQTVCRGTVLPDDDGTADYDRVPETIPALARICTDTSACVAETVRKLYDAGEPINGAIAADARRTVWGKCEK